MTKKKAEGNKPRYPARRVEVGNRLTRVVLRESVNGEAAALRADFVTFFSSHPTYKKAALEISVGGRELYIRPKGRIPGLPKNETEHLLQKLDIREVCPPAPRNDPPRITSEEKRNPYWNPRTGHHAR